MARFSDHEDVGEDRDRLRGRDACWKETLELVESTFEAEGLAPFLDFGTLLGAVRDGAFIPWDSDIDLGLVESDGTRDRLLAAARRLAEEGFWVKGFRESVYVHRTGVQVGVRRYHLDPARKAFVSRQIGPPAEGRRRTRKALQWVVYGYQFGVFPGRGTQSMKSRLAAGVTRVLLQPRIRRFLAGRLAKAGGVEERLIVVPERFLARLDKVDFHGREHRTPHDAEGYLELLYGPDWRTPRRQWDYIKDNRALEEPPT